MPTTSTVGRSSKLKLGLWGLVPLVLLVVALGLFLYLDPMQALTGGQPPVEELSIQRVELDEGGLTLHVVNAGPEPVTVAQVLVDEAYWSYEMASDPTIERLERTTVRVPYPWVQGEVHEVRVISSTGATFDYTIKVATETPRPTTSRWLLFALLGAFVGVVPVGLGMMWFPVLQRLGRQAMNFILALTVGLLVFLFVDTIVEAVEIAEQVPGVFQALPLVFVAALLSFLVLTAAGRSSAHEDETGSSGRMWIATAIALGIGLHNLGEGMAVGAAIASGQAALGSFLVVGFVLHNITEGVGIGAPMARDEPALARLVGLTLLAGAPAILGTWLGGFTYSPLLAVVFFAIGAGAILQVIIEVGRLLLERVPDRPVLASWINLSGVAAGVAVMYVTALLV